MSELLPRSGRQDTSSKAIKGNKGKLADGFSKPSVPSQTNKQPQQTSSKRDKVGRPWSPKGRK
jgi:hypothetical protein